jgi:hypothetical protein
MTRRPLRALALAIALGGAATQSCAGGHPPLGRPYPAPSAEELLRTVAAHQQAARAMNARARATSWIGGERLRATVLMLVERGGRLRFEAEISLQGTVATLTTDGARFQLLDLHANQLQQGPACPANVASLIRIPLGPAEVAAILLGDLRLPATAGAAGAGAAEVAWDAEAGADALIIKDGSRETRILLRPRERGARDIVGASATEAGRRLWRASYEELDGPAELRMPKLIRFAERDGSFDEGVEIKIKDRTLNPALRPEDFTILPPAGTSVIEVGCGR